MDEVGQHMTFLDVPVDGLISEDELVLDLGAVGQPGPFQHWSLVTNNDDENAGRMTRTIRLVDGATGLTAERVFERQPPAQGDDEPAWRRVH